MRSTKEIADGLNRDGIQSPGGGAWDRSKVRRILLNELYVGTLVYNRTTQKLKTPTRHNPKEEWIRTPEAFAPLVDRTIFDEAQRILTHESLRYTPEFMLEQLRRLIEEHEFVRPAMVRPDTEAPSPSTYAKRFASLDAAYQEVFQFALDRVKQDVETQLRAVVQEVESYDDFLVVNDRFTVLIQPSVPVPHGYSQYWYFRPDMRGCAPAGNENRDSLGRNGSPYCLVSDGIAGRCLARRREAV